MGKHAFWMASFQCLAKSLLPLKWSVHDTCIPSPCTPSLNILVLINLYN